MSVDHDSEMPSVLESSPSLLLGENNIVVGTTPINSSLGMRFLFKVKERLYMDSIKVEIPLWGGYRLFSWKRKEPFVGISQNKLLKSGETVDIELGYLRTHVQRDRQELIAVAEQNKWVGTNSRLACYYYPESYLVTGKISNE